MRIYTLVAFAAGGCSAAMYGSSSAAASEATGSPSSVIHAHSRWDKTWGIPWVSDWDNFLSRGLPSQNRSASRQLLLIRHGQYCNEKAEGCHESERKLTDIGRQQAVKTGVFLRDILQQEPASELFPCANLTAVHCSDMTRAKETCDVIVDELGPIAPPQIVHIDPLLRELFPCDPQPVYHKKSTPESQRRAEEAFEKYFYRPTSPTRSTEIIVCHANLIRYFFCRALQLPPEAWLRLSLAHCSITSIIIDGHGRVKVNGLGLATHLPSALQTTHNVK